MLWKVALASGQVWERAAARVKSWLLSSVSSLYYLSVAVAIVLFGFFKPFCSLLRGEGGRGSAHR